MGNMLAKNDYSSIRLMLKETQEKRREVLKLRQEEARERHKDVRKKVAQQVSAVEANLVEVDGHLAIVSEIDGEKVYQNVEDDTLGTRLIRLDIYLDMLGIDDSHQDEILKRFEIRSGVDDRIIEIEGLFYLDLDRYDYSNIFI